MRKNFFIMLFLLSTNIFAQSYISDDGTSAPKWRIGNSRYIELYSDNDSNFVRVIINGIEKRLATQDWILSKTKADSVRRAYNLIGGAANRIAYQVSADSTNFITTPTNNKFLFYNSGWQWKWAWGPDTTTVVRTTRTITTSDPLRIDNTTSANLSANRTLSLLYNNTNLKITSNALNTVQDIATTSSPTFTNQTLSGILTQQGIGTNYFYGDVQQSGNKSFYNNFVSGWAGSGWRIDYNGRSSAEFDDLTIRGTLSVYELLVRQIRATNGNLFVAASAKVESISGSSITFEDASNNNLCPFAPGDLVIVQRFTPNGTTLIRNVRATISSVTGRTCVVTYNTGTFQVGDEVVRIGNDGTTSGRQASIYLAADDTYSPYIDVINDVNSWSAWSSSNKTKLRIGQLNGITDSYFGTLSGYGLYSQNVYLTGNIKMNSGQISWSTVNKPTQNDLGTWTTYLTSTGIYTGTVTANQLDFTPVKSTDVIARINASSEGLDITADRISISGQTTFASGYDPTTKITTGGAATDINNNTTTILGSKVRSGLIQSNNWSGYEGSEYNLNDGTIRLGGSTSPKFSVDTYGYATMTGARIANWYIRDGIITDNLTSGNEMVVLNQTQKSIYVRPLSGNLKFIMLGQLNNGSSPGWTSTYGIGAINNSNQFLFRMDESYTQIAGIDFDFQRIYSIASGTGFEISKASSKNVTTGFAVWDITSSPKMFLGNSTSSMDWNNETPNTLTIRGKLLSSTLSTTTTTDASGGYTGSIINSNGLYNRKPYTGSYYNNMSLNGGGITFSSEGYGNIAIVCNYENRYMQIDSYNVPKYYGITNTPPTSNLKPGDFYIGTSGTLGVWTGGQWWYYNHN